MSLSREEILFEMGITPLWRLREEVSPDDEGAPDAPPVQAAADIAPAPEADYAAPATSAPAPAWRIGGSDGPSDIANLDWDGLRRCVADCRRCVLGEHRKQAVLGVGDLRPDWLFIGEGPGADEDAQGEPFVGQAGKLLDAMLAALDLKRGDKVYIGNAVKCRPPGNRTPETGEMAACRPYLERQIALLQPRIIVLLGKAAVHSILGDDKSLASLRGKPFDYQGIPVVVTYHPAYLLRNLPEKAKAWEDLLFARRLLREAQARAAAPRDGDLPF